MILKNGPGRLSSREDAAISAAGMYKHSPALPTEDVAWVYGSHKYATKIEIEHGALSTLCSCPYEGTCKHAVAVVLVCLDHLKQQQEVPTAIASDRRLKLLEDLDEEDEWDEEDEEEVEEDQDEGEEWDEEEDRPVAKRAKTTKTDAISSFLQQQTKEQLIVLVKEQAKDNPTVRQALQDQVNLSTGSVKKLVKDVREEVSEREHTPAPMIETLIDIAIAEKRPDDVLRWYNQRKPQTGNWGWGYGWSDDDKIAQAIVNSHPDRAVAIWKKMAEDLIAQTNTRAYESAATYLRKVLLIMKERKQTQEWESYLAGLRQANTRKKRLLEILDRLENRRILG